MGVRQKRDKRCARLLQYKSDPSISYDVDLLACRKYDMGEVKTSTERIRSWQLLNARSMNAGIPCSQVRLPHNAIKIVNVKYSMLVNMMIASTSTK
jgi:hypothetical protein